MTEAKKKELKITVVDYDTFSDYDYMCPATWFIVNASQEYIYFHTSKREEAQSKCDEMYGKGFYTVKTSRLQKTKSRMEGGGYSVVATATRQTKK